MKPPPYSEKELAMAIEALWERLKDLIPEAEHEAIKAAHPVVDEIDTFSWCGPAGLGLGRYGGHAV